MSLFNNSGKLFTLGSSDLVKGLLMAFLGSFVTAIIQVISDGSFPSVAELKAAALVGLSSGLAYFLKNFLTNSSDQFMKKDPQ